MRDFAIAVNLFSCAAKAQYERAIVEKPKGRKRDGRIDLLIYLPYCRVFVTHDEDQEACLREMLSVANVGAEILSYREFHCPAKPKLCAIIGVSHKNSVPSAGTTF